MEKTRSYLELEVWELDAVISNNKELVMSFGSFEDKVVYMINR